MGSGIEMGFTSLLSLFFTLASLAFLDAEADGGGGASGKGTEDGDTGVASGIASVQIGPK